MYCPNCKKTFPEDHAFCDSCGSKLVEGQATETTQTIPQPQDEPAPQPQPQPQPTPQAQQAPVFQQPPAYNPQPQYATQAAANAPKSDETVSFWTWFGLSILNVIPFFLGLVYVVALVAISVGNTENISTVGFVLLAFLALYIILLFVWAFGKPKKRSLKTYAASTLVMTFVLAVVTLFLYMTFREHITDILDNLGDLLYFYY